MPDDMPIGPQAGESAAAPAAKDQDRRRRAPEGEVRGGAARVPEPPLEQIIREERQDKPRR